MSARLGHLTLDTVDLDRAVTLWAAVFEGAVWRAPDGAIAVVSAPGAELMIQRVDVVAEGKNPIHLGHADRPRRARLRPRRTP